jgi:hypothetical protein
VFVRVAVERFQFSVFPPLQIHVGLMKQQMIARAEQAKSRRRPSG